MDRRRSIRLVVVMMLAACVPALAGQGAASAGPVRCGGRVATLVSDASKVTGTPGPDVVVVRARRVDVDARAGDDTICVRGRRGLTTVDPGRGDDRVLVQAVTTTYAELRAGRDNYRGGPGTDAVSSGAVGERNRDAVHLGRGRDALVLGQAEDHHGAALDGGAGRDEVVVTVRRGRLLVDAADRRATRRGRTVARWRSFETHGVSSAGVQSFVGTDGDDRVTFSGTGPVSAALGAGDDGVSAQFSPVFDTPPRLDGGSGTDRLTLGVGVVSSVVASLVTDTVDITPVFGDERVSFPIAGFEGLAVSADDGSPDLPEPRVELVGDEGDNLLQAATCQVVLRGGPGDDDLRVGFDRPHHSRVYLPDAPQCRRTSEVFGESGDDRLVSSTHQYVARTGAFDPGGGAPSRVVEVAVDDLLDGGEGTDRADAGKGIDTCLAEVRVGCER